MRQIRTARMCHHPCKLFRNGFDLFPHSLRAFLSQGPHERSSHTDRIRAQRQRFQDIRAALNAIEGRILNGGTA